MAFNINQDIEFTVFPDAIFLSDCLITSTYGSTGKMTGLLSLIKKYWLAMTAFTLAAITFLSLWPLPELPEMPGTDKTHHFIAYGLLMFPAALRKPRKWLLYPLIFIVYSGAIELIQPMVNRYGEWLDLGANALGLVCGIVVAEMAGLLGRLLKVWGNGRNGETEKPS